MASPDVDLVKQAIGEEQEAINKALDGVDEYLKVVKDLDYDETVEKLSPLDRAKYDLAILYALNSQYFMYVRSLGKDTTAHPVREEMERIRQITLRIGDMTKEATKRNMVIDAKAAHRMVKHGLWTPNTIPVAKKSNNVTPMEEENWDAPSNSEETSENSKNASTPTNTSSNTNT